MERIRRAALVRDHEDPEDPVVDPRGHGRVVGRRVRMALRVPPEQEARGDQREHDEEDPGPGAGVDGEHEQADEAEERDDERDRGELT